MACFHLFEDGHGLMGDALDCVKCGYSKYPEVLPHYWFYKLLNRIYPYGDKRLDEKRSALTRT